MKIGSILLKLRKGCRLSQIEVAERVGVCQSAYCAWESDRAMPSARHYGSLATLFEIDLEALMLGNLVSRASPQSVPLLPIINSPVGLQEEIIQAQRETIALQKHRIEHLESENKQLRQLLTSTGNSAGT